MSKHNRARHKRQTEAAHSWVLAHIHLRHASDPVRLILDRDVDGFQFRQALLAELPRVFDDQGDHRGAPGAVGVSAIGVAIGVEKATSSLVPTFEQRGDSIALGVWNSDDVLSR
eukprot:96461-Prymnesium_polylepis.2